MNKNTLLVTGGAGFIGSALIRQLISETDFTVINIDKLTYAGNLESLTDIDASPNYHFEQADICDAEAMDRIFSQYQPSAMMHLAAESHVDRSIDGPADFVQTNVVGTYILLEAARKYWKTLVCLLKPLLTSLTHHTLQQKQAVTIWFVPGTILTVCQC